MQRAPPGPARGLTTLRLGGPARRLLVAETEDELVEAVRGRRRRPASRCWSSAAAATWSSPTRASTAPCVQVATRGVAVAALAEHALQVDGRRATGTTSWRLTVERGLRRARGLSGIPGRVGATPIQNVGAYGQEVAQTVGWVRALDRSDPRRRPAARRSECGFGYRDSVFKRSDRYVVLAVAFAARALPARRTGPLRRAGPPRSGSRSATRVPAADVRAAVLELRRGKGMVLDADDHDTWSAGSFFTNPVLAARARRPPAAGDRAAVARPTTAGSRPPPPG